MVWEIYFLSYPKVRSWHTFSVDKTTAPHRWRYIVCLLGRVVYAYDVGAIVNHLYCMLKNGQVSQLKIIKITPSRVLPRWEGCTLPGNVGLPVLASHAVAASLPLTI